MRSEPVGPYSMGRHCWAAGGSSAWRRNGRNHSKGGEKIRENYLPFVVSGPFRERTSSFFRKIASLV